jgi:uncharacterized membrane protein YedE/YeeE
VRNLVAFVAGLLFAIGLALSGMTLPAKVTGFLDVTGHWDPSLAFVMMGAIGVYASACVLARRLAKPAFAERFDAPARKDITARLLVGAAVFGVGWGLAGYCPGPAIASVGAGVLPAVSFAVAMLVGMLVHQAVHERTASRRQPVAEES